SGYQKKKAKELRCIFADLVATYDLSPCGTGKWRNAKGPHAAKQLERFYNYFPELSSRSLEEYSICSIHYNQINSDQFYEHIVGYVQEKKRSRLETSYADLAAELEETKKLLELARLENQELTNRIEQMIQYFDDKKKEMEALKTKLEKTHNNMVELRSFYDEQKKRNDFLIERWNSRFSDQQKRMDAIVEIAKAERTSLFEDIELLFRDNNRFTMECIMAYSPREWLNRRNLVVVKFIETLIHNEARQRKYVSEIQLALSAIKYSIARSRMIINIDNHITNSGREYQFQKWLEKLSQHEEPLPEGLLFLAFDNEQRGQKNYLDRGFNTVIYHIVTSFVGFNMAPQNKIQNNDLTWTCDSLDRSQYDELFDVNTQMQKVIDEELHLYLNEILNLLFEEKLSNTNSIDSLIASTGTKITNMKKCPKCGQKNIENRKKICPKCEARLPTLAEIQREQVVENNTTDQLAHPLIFKPYITNDEPKNITSVPRISLTQQTTDPRVNVPEIYIPNPININPNSISNVEKILLHIKEISGIKSGSRK
ncbi:hypothetical protein C2G38_2235955, partial [Gigaspora rosea]